MQDLTYGAKVVADSVSERGKRLTTFEVTMPRKVLAEFNTHRMFSRNSASSRAIPVLKMIERVGASPYIPSSWGKNQKGMRAEEEFSDDVRPKLESVWLGGRDAAVRAAQTLMGDGVHKQITNRLLEPFMWHTVIVTATDWSNFFNLRDSEMADPDIHEPARLMRKAYDASDPILLKEGEWHLPFIQPDELDRLREDYAIEGPSGVMDWVKVSTARCARVSYLTHDGVRDVRKDLELHGKLLESGHMSPFEHAARPMNDVEWDATRLVTFVLDDGSVWVVGRNVSGGRVGDFVEDFERRKIVARRETHYFGNFDGWTQYRKTLPWEHDPMENR